MNITGFGLPFAYGDPTNYGGAAGANLWAWITTNMLGEGESGCRRGHFLPPDDVDDRVRHDPFLPAAMDGGNSL